MQASLSGKTVVIMGGTTGLGLSAAQAVVAAGGRVVVVGRNVESVRTAGEKIGGETVAAAFSGDACRPETAPAAIALAVERFGSCDALYHVAGGSGRSLGDGPLHELTDAGWAATLDLNLTSVMLSNRAAVRHFLAEGRGGAILNMGSVLGWSPAPKYFGTHAYAATKAAVIGFTKAIAAAYAPRNVRANVIAPALVETPMARRAAGDETILSYIRTKQPLDGGRIGRPDDCDAAVVYLLSDAARFVTGQVLAVDGGWTLSDGQFTES